MNKVFTLLFLLLLTTNVFSQKNLADEEEEIETIFGTQEVANGGYGAPEMKVTPFLGNHHIVTGGRGGWIINHTFSIGGAGYGLVTGPEVPDYIGLNRTDTVPHYLRAGWGGLFFQYMYNSNKAIHFTVNTMVGIGGAALTPSYLQMDQDDSSIDVIDYDGSAFFIVEPGIGVEFNILTFFRIEIGASYRWTNGLDLPNIEDKDISGPSYNLAFRFGKF